MKNENSGHVTSALSVGDRDLTLVRAPILLDGCNFEQIDWAVS